MILPTESFGRLALTKFRVFLLAPFCVAGLFAQLNSIEELIEAARVDSPKLAELLGRKDAFGYRIPNLNERIQIIATLP